MKHNCYSYNISEIVCEIVVLGMVLKPICRVFTSYQEISALYSKNYHLGDAWNKSWKIQTNPITGWHRMTSKAFKLVAGLCFSNNKPQHNKTHSQLTMRGLLVFLAIQLCLITYINACKFKLPALDPFFTFS